jgi:hypothetical protein
MCRRRVPRALELPLRHRQRLGGGPHEQQPRGAALPRHPVAARKDVEREAREGAQRVVDDGDLGAEPGLPMTLEEGWSRPIDQID